MKTVRVITIAREYGSGGAAIAEELAIPGQLKGNVISVTYRLGAHDIDALSIDSTGPRKQAPALLTGDGII